MTSDEQDRRPRYGQALPCVHELQSHVRPEQLTIATGCDGAALAIASRTIPAEPRGRPLPFGSVVPDRAGAGPTTRLARWNGRTGG